MEITVSAEDHLELRHDGVAGARTMLWIVIGSVAVVALGALVGGSWWALVVALAVGALLVTLLRRSSALSTVVFDKAAGTVTVTHSRDGREIASQERPIGDIARVIVEAAGRGDRHDRVLKLRPALVVDEAILPLTFRAFVGGAAAVEAATAMRRFLGHSESGLYEDSVEALAGYTDRVNPAVRIARLGLGMGHLEAARHVARLRGGD